MRAVIFWMTSKTPPLQARLSAVDRRRAVWLALAGRGTTGIGSDQRRVRKKPVYEMSSKGRPWRIGIMDIAGLALF